MTICNSCGTENTEDTEYCVKCGSSFIAAEEESVLDSVACPNCRQISLSNMPFCSNCGARLHVREVQPRTFTAVPVDRKAKYSVVVKILVIVGICVIAALVLYVLFIMVIVILFIALIFMATSNYH